MSKVRTPAEHFAAAFYSVNQNVTAALGEIATELGGEDLAAQVKEIAGTTEVLPNPEALKLLQKIDPEAGDRVLDRADQIGAERRAQEIAELRRHRIKRGGNVLLQGFGVIAEGMLLRTGVQKPRNKRNS